MRVVSKDLMAMKVDELKEELEAQGEGTSGNKAWLGIPTAATARKIEKSGVPAYTSI